MGGSFITFMTLTPTSTDDYATVRPWRAAISSIRRLAQKPKGRDEIEIEFYGCFAVILCHHNQFDSGDLNCSLMQSYQSSPRPPKGTRDGGGAPQKLEALTSGR